MDLRTLENRGRKIGVNGVMDMTKACGLSYERTVRVWNGSKEAKFKDVEKVLNTLDIKLILLYQRLNNES